MLYRNVLHVSVLIRTITGHIYWKSLKHQYQYSENNVMHFSFNFILLILRYLYMFRIILAQLRVVFHKRHLVECVCVL
jgi:hypothetical protein